MKSPSLSFRLRSGSSKSGLPHICSGHLHSQTRASWGARVARVDELPALVTCCDTRGTHSRETLDQIKSCLANEIMPTEEARGNSG